MTSDPIQYRAAEVVLVLSVPDQVFKSRHNLK